MIGTVFGHPTDGGNGFLIIQTAGGVGYRIAVSGHTKETVLAQGEQNREVSLYTHTVSREGAIELYGFETHSAYTTFLLLLSVSGIGPKTGLGVLNTVTPRALCAAIQAKDAKSLITYGVAKRIAERIVFELQGKVTVDDAGTGNTDVIAALIALGYDTKEVQEAMRAINTSSGDTGALLKEAMRALRARGGTGDTVQEAP